MSSNIVDYIILAIIFIVVIHVIIQIFGKNCKAKEYMEELSDKSNKQQSNSLFDSMKSEDRNNLEKDNSNKIIASQQVKSCTSNDNSNKIIESQSKSNESDTSHGNTNKIGNYKNKICPVDEMDNSIDKYLKQYVLTAKHENEQKQFTRDEIKGYQSKFFAFEPTLNKSSSDVIDCVDKLNELQTTGNNEFSKEHGKKISEVYDDLTKNKFDMEKQCKYPKCIIPPKEFIDDERAYLDSDGLTFNKTNWKYETDNVNNGGKFYDSIEGYDTSSENNLVIV